jgi:SAM-dependent methyltransferase
MMSGGQAQLLALVHGQGAAHALRAVTQLGIPAQLREGPRSAADLAAASGAAADKVYRVMRALACYGVFAEHEDGRFSLDEAGEALAEASGGMMEAAVLYATEPGVVRAWSELGNSLARQTLPFPLAHGRPFYQHLAEDRPLSESFHRMVAGLGHLHVPLILEHYDFGPYRTVVDVGGGRGELLAAILAGDPTKQGVLLEQADVAAALPHDIPAAIRERIRVVEGSFFDVSVPDGDVYVLKNVIHNWEDQDALRILRRCRTGMRPGARLLVVEHVIPDGPGFHVGKLLDMTMMVTTGGLERTESQHRALFSAAGLGLVRYLPTPGPIALLECEPR